MSRDILIDMNTQCPLCLSKNTSPFISAFDTENQNNNKYIYYRCHNCSLILLYPPPKPENLNGFYRKKYYEGCNFPKYLQLERKWKIKHILPKRTLLDFGCGDGIFLSLIKDRYRVGGFDISQEIAENIYKKFKIKVYTDLKELDTKYDCITLWHTLEHLPEPLRTLKKLKSILSDNGCLVIAVPNINSFESVYGKEKWFHLDPPRHLMHYNHQSLALLLKQVGFKILKEDNFSIEYDFASLWQTLLNKWGSYPNFFYHLVKRQPVKDLSKFDLVRSWLTTIILGPIIIIPVIILVIFLSVFKKTGSFTVYAQKNPSHQS